MDRDQYPMKDRGSCGFKRIESLECLVPVAGAYEA